MYFGGILVLFTLVVVDPVIAAAIGYAAWRGKPQGFDRQTYWLLSVVALVSGFAGMVLAQRMQTDVRTAQYVLEVLCFETGAVLFGVAAGFLVGGFTYQRGSLLRRLQ